MNKGILVVVSGFSGAGKGTVMKRLMEKYDGYALSVSATTRKPRPGEEDGREYFFRTRDEFEKLIEEDALLEYAQYVENYYGTPRSYVEEQLQAGRNVILEIGNPGRNEDQRENTGSTSGVCNSADCGGTGTPSHRQRNRNRTGDRRQTCKSR